MGDSSSQPRTDPDMSPINAFPVEEFRDLTNEKEEGDRNRQKRTIQSDDATQNSWTTEEEIMLSKDIYYKGADKNDRRTCAGHISRNPLNLTRDSKIAFVRRLLRNIQHSSALCMAHCNDERASTKCFGDICEHNMLRQRFKVSSSLNLTQQFGVSLAIATSSSHGYLESLFSTQSSVDILDFEPGGKLAFNESGVRDEDCVQRAMVHYEVETELPFRLRHCWEILKDRSKWQEVVVPNFDTESGEGRDKARAAGKNKGSKAPRSLYVNEDALARLMVTEMTA
ncbi:hypothetical protein Tco_1307173 [Tanacetum coccineum]